jgi:hypothetical protein
LHTSDDLVLEGDRETGKEDTEAEFNRIDAEGDSGNSFPCGFNGAGVFQHRRRHIAGETSVSVRLRALPPPKSEASILADRAVPQRQNR